MDLSQIPVQRSIPVLLKVGLGATQIVAKDHAGGRVLASWEVVNGHDVFGVKFGGPDSPVAGTLVGERYSRDILRSVIRADGLPLPIMYEPTDRDDDLMKLVLVDGKPAWDALVVPQAEKLGISVDPGPVAPNSSAGAPGVPPGKPAPVVLPPPPPTPPAAPVAAAPDRQLAIQRLTADLEALFPGEAAKYGGLVQLLLAGGKPTIASILLAVLPLLE